MLKTLLLLACLCTLSACAAHPDCERADVFGHCKQWTGQPQTCANPDFLGFCPPGRN